MRIRKQIDQLDEAILALLNQRFALAIKTGRYKSRLSDKKREKEVLANLKRKSTEFAHLPPGFLGSIYREIFAESRRQQRKKTKGQKVESKKRSEDQRKSKISMTRRRILMK